MGWKSAREERERDTGFESGLMWEGVLVKWLLAYLVLYPRACIHISRRV